MDVNEYIQALRDEWPNVPQNLGKYAKGFGGGLLDNAKGIVQGGIQSTPSWGGLPNPWFNPQANVDAGQQSVQMLAKALKDPSSVAQAAGNAMSNPEQMGRLASGLISPNKLAEVGPLREMVAYHGTPHTLPPTAENPLGQFDLLKIGTGEGAQSYGHGIYVAENPAVAGGYRQVAEVQPGFGNYAMSDAAKTHLGQLGQQADKAGNQTASYVYSELQAGDFPPDVLRRKLDSSLKVGELSPEEHAQGIAALGIAQQELKKFTGNLYHVDIPDEHIDRMLDWDKPISSQAHAARFDFGVARNPDPLPGEQWVVSANLPSGRREVNAFPTRKAANEWTQNVTGGEFYQALDPTMGAPNVSKQLNAMGIPGIKYLDAGSRGAGDGTRNFVLFDPSIAKIVKRE